MLYVVLLHYTEPLAAVDAVRPEHLAHVERGARDGIFCAWARRDPPLGGVIVAAAPDRESVEAVVGRDPYVRAGVARAEIVEFKAANVRGGLASLSTGPGP